MKREFGTDLIHVSKKDLVLVPRMIRNPKITPVLDPKITPVLNPKNTPVLDQENTPVQDQEITPVLNLVPEPGIFVLLKLWKIITNLEKLPNLAPMMILNCAGMRTIII